VEEETPQETKLSSSAYNDFELNELMKQAQAEPMPPRLGEEESMLRLKNAGEIMDLGRIRFEFNSTTLTKQALEVVYRLHEQLLMLNPSSVKIEGHTDSIGSSGYNLPLSKRRAESVKAELVRLGQNPAIITTEGFAFHYPVASNATKEGRAANRRIEVALNGESFRKARYTPEERRQFEEWIRPGGKPPNKNK
jgi:outer membrane protein OmpA-like peptidoglycan-associated protein